jgi:hypothetical protein
MLNQLFPSRFANDYRGSKIALWLFGILLLLKLTMSLNSTFNGYHVATTADGIPLDTFPPAAAQTIVRLFASWGTAHLTITLLGILALIRYRSMVPLMFAAHLFEFLLKKVATQLLPAVKTATAPGSYVNIASVHIDDCRPGSVAVEPACA